MAIFSIKSPYRFQEKHNLSLPRRRQAKEPSEKSAIMTLRGSVTLRSQSHAPQSGLQAERKSAFLVEAACRDSPSLSAMHGEGSEARQNWVDQHLCLSAAFQQPEYIQKVVSHRDELIQEAGLLASVGTPTERRRPGSGGEILNNPVSLLNKKKHLLASFGVPDSAQAKARAQGAVKGGSAVPSLHPPDTFRLLERDTLCSLTLQWGFLACLSFKLGQFLFAMCRQETHVEIQTKTQRRNDWQMTGIRTQVRNLSMGWLESVSNLILFARTTIKNQRLRPFSAVMRHLSFVCEIPNAASIEMFGFCRSNCSVQNRWNPSERIMNIEVWNLPCCRSACGATTQSKEPTLYRILSCGIPFPWRNCKGFA